MFKPNYGICVCHSEKRLIVVKSGHCKQGNDERKKKTNVHRANKVRGNSDNKSTSIKRRGSLFTGSDGNTEDSSSSIYIKKCNRNNIWETDKKRQEGNKKVSGFKCRKKPTGEKEVFQKILEERGSYSQVSGQYLGEGFNPWWFSHIVPKSIAPRLRLDPKNIILKTPEEHTLWENHKHKIRDDIKWKWIFELEEQLKQEYNQKQK